MPYLVVREGFPLDFEAIWAINAEGQPGVSAFSRAELTALLSDPKHVWVAVGEDSSVAGYCVTYRSSEEYDGEEFAWFNARYPAFLYIDQIAVAATHRRMGVGAHLYATITRRAREFDAHALACEVNLKPPNPTSLAFHTRIGFSEVGALDISDGRNVALMVKHVEA